MNMTNRNTNRAAKSFGALARGVMCAALLGSTALAQSVSFEGGSASISDSGQISGSWEDINEVPGNPTEVDKGSISGQISPDGTISGSFQGVDTYNKSEGGIFEVVSEAYSGAFSGTIDENGNYSVSWGGSEGGSRTGRIPGFSLPGSKQSQTNNQNQNQNSSNGQNTSNHEDAVSDQQQEQVRNNSEFSSRDDDDAVHESRNRNRQDDSLTARERRQVEDIRERFGDETAKNIESIYEMRHERERRARAQENQRRARKRQNAPDNGPQANRNRTSPDAQLDQVKEIAEGTATVGGTALQQTGSTVGRRALGGTAAGPTPVAGVIVDGGRAVLDPNTGRAAINRIKEGQGRTSTEAGQRYFDPENYCRQAPEDCVNRRTLRDKGY